MSSIPVLSVRDVSKTIRGRSIVEHISFDVFKNEIVGFLGANGAGKTTTIRMMVGLIQPSAGEVLIGGISVQKNFESAMQQVGCIVETPQLYPYLTGRENLEHCRRMQNNIPLSRIEEVTQLVDLTEAIDHLVSTYSLGMKQRLGIAQALLGNPKLLILDEPTNGLDPVGIRELRQFIKSLAKEQGIAVLISSHLLSEVQAICDRVAIIDRGKMIKVAPIDKLISGDHQIIKCKLHPIDRAEALLRQMEGIQILSVEADDISIRLDAVDSNVVVELLVKSGIQVFTVEAKMNTLEDLFLTLTGGDPV